MDSDDTPPVPVTVISIDRGRPPEGGNPFQENIYYLEWTEGERYKLELAHMYPLEFCRAFMSALRTYEASYRGQPLSAEAPGMFADVPAEMAPPISPCSPAQMWKTIEVLPRTGLIVRVTIEWWHYECLHPPLFTVDKQHLFVWTVLSPQEPCLSECAWITTTSRPRMLATRAGFLRGMDAFGYVYGQGACVVNEVSIFFQSRHPDELVHAVCKVFVKYAPLPLVEFVLPECRTLIWREELADPRVSWVEICG